MLQNLLQSEGQGAYNPAADEKLGRNKIHNSDLTERKDAI